MDVITEKVDNFIEFVRTDVWWAASVAGKAWVSADLAMMRTARAALGPSGILLEIGTMSEGELTEYVAKKKRAYGVDNGAVESKFGSYLSMFRDLAALLTEDGEK